MRLHPRMTVCRKAAVEIDLSIQTIAEKHGLTDVELIGILLGHLQSTTKFMLRSERHPTDPDKGADEA